MLDLLEPGCNGVISDYKSIPRSRFKEANEFIMSLGPSMPEDFDPKEEFEEYNDFGGSDIYAPHVEFEFGGQGLHEDEYNHDYEGGGDYEDHLHRDHYKDEL